MQHPLRALGAWVVVLAVLVAVPALLPGTATAQDAGQRRASTRRCSPTRAGTAGRSTDPSRGRRPRSTERRASPEAPATAHRPDRGASATCSDVCCASATAPARATGSSAHARRPRSSRSSASTASSRTARQVPRRCALLRRRTAPGATAEESGAHDAVACARAGCREPVDLTRGDDRRRGTAHWLRSLSVRARSRCSPSRCSACVAATSRWRPTPPEPVIAPQVAHEQPRIVHMSFATSARRGNAGRRSASASSP